MLVLSCRRRTDEFYFLPIRGLMHTSPALLLAATPQTLVGLPDFTTIDGQRVSYLEGTLALRTGHALLIGDLLVVRFHSSQPVPYPATESYVRYGTM